MVKIDERLVLILGVLMLVTVSAVASVVGVVATLWIVFLSIAGAALLYGGILVIVSSGNTRGISHLRNVTPTVPLATTSYDGYMPPFIKDGVEIYMPIAR